MMVNRHRGEISATLDGTQYTLVLTLGALAELEVAFGSEDMLELAARFDGGRLKARDCVRIIGAGLRAAGYAVQDAEVANMQCDGGAAGFVAIVVDLLRATFAGDGTSSGAEGEAQTARPFPGAT